MTRGWRALVITVVTLCLTMHVAHGLARSPKPDPGAATGRPRTVSLSQAGQPHSGSAPDLTTLADSLAEEDLFPGYLRIAPASVRGQGPVSRRGTASDEWVAAPLPVAMRSERIDDVSGAACADTLTVATAYRPDVPESPTTEVSLRVTDELTQYIHLPVVAGGYHDLPPPRVPNDAHINQWALGKVMASAAWGYSTGEGTVIAVIDSGIDTDHPDLASKLWVNEGEGLDPDNGIDDDGNGYVDDVHGWRFELYGLDGPDVDDDNGHGTHVAGIAAAATDNGIGVAGLGWQARIQVIKALNDEGDGWLTDIVDAIFYAADNDADVINLSLGLAEACACPPLLQGAVNYARDQGAVVIAAAGNTSLEPPETYPANCDGVLGVAATDRYDLRASYSNTGAHVSVAAPGGTPGCSTCQIYSTAWSGDSWPWCWGRQYCYKQGTSMAAPHVAGLAALLAARYPSYTPDQAASAILDNAEDLGTGGWDEEYGCGRIDAAAALANGAVGPEPVCLQGLARSSPPGRGEEGAAIDSAEAAFAPGEVIVALRPGVSASTALARYGTALERLPRLEAWRLRVPEGREKVVAARLRGEPTVLYAHLNHLVSAY